MLRTVLFFCLMSHGVGVPAWSTLDDWAAVVATQIRDKRPLPVLSAYGAGLSVSDAYSVQRKAIDALAKPGDIAGFRASLTRPRGQVQFGVREPVTGTMLRTNLLRPHAELRLRNFKRLMIAPSLGFVLKSAVNAPLADIAQLDSLIGTVMPVVEFSDYHFERPALMRGEDFIAGNAAFSKLIVGKPLGDTSKATVDGLFVELLLAETVIDRGRAINVMGSQRTALYWLINKLLAQGWRLPAGTLLVTGAFSDPVPATKGSYLARFWEAGDIRFTITP
jgi:2-keto-4-pentenoate hydratase